MFCCLTASTARALLCISDAKFRKQVMADAVVASPNTVTSFRQHRHLEAGEVTVVVSWWLNVLATYKACLMTGSGLFSSSATLKYNVAEGPHPVTMLVTPAMES